MFFLDCPSNILPNWEELGLVSTIPPGSRARFYIHRNDYSDIHWQGINQPLHMFFNLLKNTKVKVHLLNQNISKQPNNNSPG
jgi:hypothetical protein